MPAHTYMRTGNYAGAVKATVRAAEADRKYLEETRNAGPRPALRYTHHLDALASAAMMTGQFAEATKAADQVAQNAAAAAGDMPMLERIAAKKMFVLLRFARWGEVLALPAPDPRAAVATALHHFARGVAHAKLGAVQDADCERDAYHAARQRAQDGAAIGANSASAVLAVADATLDARIAAARGDLTGAIESWQKAVAAEDILACTTNRPAGTIRRANRWARLIFRPTARTMPGGRTERTSKGTRESAVALRALAGVYPDGTGQPDVAKFENSVQRRVDGRGWAELWVAAAGLGWPIRLWFARCAREGPVIQLGGVARAAAAASTGSWLGARGSLNGVTAWNAAPRCRPARLAQAAQPAHRRLWVSRELPGVPWPWAARLTPAGAAAAARHELSKYINRALRIALTGIMENNGLICLSS